MKKAIFPILFTLAFVSIPLSVKADFDPVRLIDPFCFFSCDDEPEVINQTTNNTNSNNVNSNINSPNSTVMSGSETATPTYSYDNDYNDYNDPLYASCYSTPTSASVGDSIHWRASVHGGNGNYNITWSGTNGLDGNGSSVTKRYNSDGTKNASIRVRSGDRTVTRNCSSVEIYDYDRNDNDDRYDYDRDYDRDYDDDRYLSVSCSVNPSFTTIGTRVTWNAYVSGASGSYRYEWVGSDQINGSSRSLTTSYNTPGSKYASVTVRSGSRRVTAMCTNYLTVSAPTSYYGNPYPQYPTYTPPVKNTVVKKPVAPVVEKPEVKADDSVTLASLFSLSNVPWGLVAVLVILVLLSMVVYLIWNNKKI